jgi:muramoyltetrapeptide carboxypeptidase
VAGPVLVQFGPEMPEYTWASWERMVRGPFLPGPLPLPEDCAARPLPGSPDGVAEGTLLPCNLSLLASLIGTPYLPALGGAILALEEVHETPQSLDRMVTSLRLSGADSGLAGVVLGQFTECLPRNPDVTEEEGRRVVREWAASLGVPVLADFPFGHEPLCCTLPFGTRARITLSPPGVELVEPSPAL